VRRRRCSPPAPFCCLGSTERARVYPLIRLYPAIRHQSIDGRGGVATPSFITHETDFTERRIHMRKSVVSTVAPASPALVIILSATGPVIEHLAMQALAALVRWRRARVHPRQHLRAMAQLSAFSDHELKDIGVYRSEIRWVVNHGRHAPPARMSPQ
jgi:uncharacterized protein YjiS (DUF1127 family)